MRQWLLLAAMVALLHLTGCATNPVTGKNELSLVSENQELEIGKKQYAPSRQMQGGDYILDRKLTEYVQQVGNRLAAVSDRKLPYEFVVLNDSTPNAWALPGGKIAVNRGLLVELGSEAELAAVIGHEIVHAAARHGAKGMERGMLLQGAIAVAGAAASGSDYSQLAVGAAAVGANLINQSYSRDAESESDYYGMQYMVRAGYDPRAAIELQETFVRLSESKQSNWLAGLFASHPPSRERVEANRKTAATLATGGEIGRERYQQMTAYIRKLKPAYAAYEKGAEALEKKSYVEALQLAEQALAMEPREGLFHSLKGDVLAAQGQDAKALAYYDKAVTLNPGYFRHYLQRGESLTRVGNRARAVRDLEKSVELLPTANAYYSLGILASAAGDKATAISHLRQAASGKSATSQMAGNELVKLDLPNNPDAYLQASVGNYQNRLIVAVQNTTRAEIGDLNVVVVRYDGLQHRYKLSQRLPAGKILRFSTDIPLTNPQDLKLWQARVVSAGLTGQ